VLLYLEVGQFHGSLTDAIACCLFNSETAISTRVLRQIPAASERVHSFCEAVINCCMADCLILFGHKAFKRSLNELIEDMFFFNTNNMQPGY
jgi:hypothetical protein